MTLRAFFCALLCIAFIAGFGFFNDAILYQTMLVGNFMPMSVFGLLIVTLFLLNPLLSAIYRHSKISFIKPFSGRELCLILAIILPACCIPYSSLMRIFPRATMLPHFYAQKEPSWRLQNEKKETFLATKLVPERMLATPAFENGDDSPLTGIVQGLQPKPGEAHISPDAIPWGAWKDALLFWMPLFMALWLALAGLAMVCYNQWANNEHLPYPVVQFAQSLMPDAQGNVSSIFKNKFFWIALAFVFIIHINNLLTLYHTEYLIPVQRNFNFLPMRKIFTTISRGGGYPLFWIRIYFSALAIAYLLPSDVSLGVGLGPFVGFWITGLLASWGIAFRSGAPFAARMDTGALMGAYVALACIMLYTGRHYYWSSLCCALGFRKKQNGGEIPPLTIWGMRIFLLAIIAFIAILSVVGLDWQLSMFLAFAVIIVYMVFGRIIAETGLFYFSPGLYPSVIIVALLGEQALGPSTLAIIFLVTTFLFGDARETFMPFMVNSMKLSQESRTKPTRFFPMLATGMCLCLLIAVPVTLYFCYDNGTNWRDGFATNTVPRMTFTSALAARRTLIAQGMLEHSETVSGLQRFIEMKPNANFLIAFGIAAILVALFSYARLRWPKWPIHPVMFCIWSGYAGYMMAWSFILGGITKIAIMRFGGSRCYQQLKPLMFGLIAGDMLAGLVVIASGAIYYFTTGELPKQYFVLPG